MWCAGPASVDGSFSPPPPLPVPPPEGGPPPGAPPLRPRWGSAPDPDRPEGPRPQTPEGLRSPGPASRGAAPAGGWGVGTANPRPRTPAG
ncbi:hypothetical protein TN53_14660 [Streptomyces sp. WM6386]|nr:hypothetical protein TN53_14660 [Streptomyces sp. WM6386]